MTNDAAERLRSKMHSDWDGTDWIADALSDLDEALADERRATVERIRAALFGPDRNGGLFFCDKDAGMFAAILDAEADR